MTMMGEPEPVYCPKCGRARMHGFYMDPYCECKDRPGIGERQRYFLNLEWKTRMLFSDIEDCLGYAELHLMYGDDVWVDYIDHIDTIIDKIHDLRGSEQTPKEA